MVVSVQEGLTLPEPELADVMNFQEETPDRDPLDTTYNNSEESNRHDNFSQHIPNHTPVHHSTGQHQITSRHTINSEEIPQLKEDWDNGQFADADTNLINKHNKHSESERIRKEYTKHLLDLSNNQYYSKENPTARRLQTQPHHPAGFYPSPPDTADIQCWHARGRGKSSPRT